MLLLTETLHRQTCMMHILHDQDVFTMGISGGALHWDNKDVRLSEHVNEVIQDPK